MKKVLWLALMIGCFFVPDAKGQAPAPAAGAARQTGRAAQPTEIVRPRAQAEAKSRCRSRGSCR